MHESDIVIRGAREHNLRDVSLRLPRNKLIAMTGDGSIENQSACTLPFTLMLGFPLELERQIMVKDTAMMQALLVNGIHPKAYIELVDSATNAVLATLDSRMAKLGIRRPGPTSRGPSPTPAP